MKRPSARVFQRGTALGLTAALLSMTVPGLRGQAPTPSVAGFDALFKVGGGLIDTNDDQVSDGVSASLVLGDSPSDEEIAGAADIAARLGFETMAMDLPLQRGAGGAIIVAVGAAGLAKIGVDAVAIGTPDLKAGEGLIALTAAGGRTVVAVTGGDAAGVRSAATALASRVPYVWDPKGATLKKVADDLDAALSQDGLKPTTTAVVALRTRVGADAFDRIVLRTEVGTAADAGRARAVLARLRPGMTRAAVPGDTPAPSGAAALSYDGATAIEVRIAGGVKPETVLLARLGDRPAPDQPPARRAGTGAKEALDLSSLFANDGLLGDSDNNLIPDRTDAVLSASGPAAAGVVDVAARIGLESTGVSLPLVIPPAALGKPESQPTLVLVGASHPVVTELAKAGKFTAPALQAGDGLIQVVRKAFGDKGAVVITGGNDAGVQRALQQVSEKFPHIWQRGKDRTTLDDVEDDVRRFVAGRTPAGQAAAALYKLDQLAAKLADRNLQSAKVRVHVEKAADGLDAVVRDRVAASLKARSLDVLVENIDVQKGRMISDDAYTVPSEVDEFRRAVRQEVLPRIRKKQPVVLEARLSESPEIRALLVKETTDALVKAGASPQGTTVVILSAYKQGLSWLDEVIKPQLAGKPIGQITVRFAEIGAPKEWPQQAMYTPTRWLLELFPADEILARDLQLQTSQVVFEKMPVGTTPTYEVVATSQDGREILKQTFDPKYVLRSYFDVFPDYEKVRITTGWLTARQGTVILADRRIATDPERFWDRFQSVTLKRMYDYVMAMENGKPRADSAPFFGELRAEVSLSEPDYALGVDKEHISPHESIHEDLYFGVLHFFDVLGRYTRGPALTYPGRVIPIVRPKNDGMPGTAHVTFTGFLSSRPKVAIEYVEEGGARGVLEMDVPKVAVERPSATAATVKDGQDGLSSLSLHMKVDTDRDERDALVARARAERVDSTMMSAEQVGATLTNLQALRQAGLYGNALAYPNLGPMTVVAHWTHDATPQSQRAFTLAANGTPDAYPDSTRFLPSGYRHAGGPIVQWDTPIPPTEAYELLAKMAATFPEASTYKLGESYLGKDVWAMDVMSPVTASHWSQAKATTVKPTVVYSARQHANEVSSTSHTLKFAEVLLTDPQWKTALKKVNFVFHPITNADGAQTAYDLYKITPDHMLHAGYLGSLGVDVTNQQWDQDPIYPESKYRADLWRTWLPDVYLNPHGYPSHEWVMLFSEYAGWVRSRVTEARDWWGMRGWFTPGFSYLDDPRYPRHKDAAFEIRDRFTRNINAAPDMSALNMRGYARYRKYGSQFDNDNFKLDFTNGVLVYSAIKGARATAQSQDFVARNPNVTIWFGSTEAPDETAYGDYMKVVATAGLQWDKAIAEYLLAGRHQVERKEDSFFGGVSLSISRPRPPKPVEKATAPPTDGGGRR